MQRSDEDKLQAQFEDVAAGVNTYLSAVTQPIVEALKYVNVQFMIPMFETVVCSV